MLKDVPLNIRRSKRKTISIYIERDGTVTVRAPESMDDNELEQAVQTKEYLIYKHLAEWEQLNSSRVEREFVNGQSFLYLGRNYRLRFVEDQAVPLQLKNGFFQLRQADQHQAEKCFITFYKEKILPRIESKVDEYKGKMGVVPNEVRVMELQNRWASCSSKKNLNFHWKCAMAPIRTMEYIVVHELAHLIHMNHSPEFWKEIDKVFPDYQKEVQWLREHGASMDL